MPNFETSTGKEVYLPSVNPVFRRGKRLDDATCRRMRDMVLTFFRRMGMDSEDCARIFAMKLTGRQVRNRVDETPADIQAVLERMANLYVAAAFTELRVKIPRKRCRAGRRRPARKHRQLLIFDMLEADGGEI